MHASAVLVGGECLVFTGPPGSGKSARVAQHILQGGTLVADDVVRCAHGITQPPSNIAGILALRDYGLVRLPFTITKASARLIVCDDLPDTPITVKDWQKLCAMGEVLPEDWMPARLPIAESGIICA